jgi:ribosome-associated toxin RatA of RatAB toxin-antitoxin module
MRLYLAKTDQGVDSISILSIAKMERINVSSQREKRPCLMPSFKYLRFSCGIFPLTSALRQKAVFCAMAMLVFMGSAFADSGNLLMVSIASTPRQGNIKTVNARVLIQAPPNLVWDMLTDYPGWSAMMPWYDKSQVLSVSGSSTLMDVAMRVNSLLPTYKYRVRAQENKASYQLSMTRLSGDFKSLNASYKLTPQNQGAATLLTYQLNIDTGFSMPGSIALIRANTEKSMKALESYAEQAFHQRRVGHH